MRNLEKFWCNDHLEEVAGDCGRYFPGGKEACLEQAERILKNSFVFQEHWEMERTHEAVVLEIKSNGMRFRSGIRNGFMR